MKKMVVMLSALALFATACSTSGPISADDAWARESAMMQSAAAVYMDLTADEDDALVSASVESSVAPTVEIHETTEMGPDDEMSGDDDDMGEEGDMSGDGGMMQMVPVEQVDLPAGETVSLEPGGLHIMLLDLTEPLEIGDEFDVDLEFESGETLSVTVEVREG